MTSARDYGSVDVLLDLLAELTDDDVCRYDHNGNCQTHRLDPRPCPQERARAILAKRGQAS
jgi:hypothetical protein